MSKNPVRSRWSGNRIPRNPLAARSRHGKSLTDIYIIREKEYVHTNLGIPTNLHPKDKNKTPRK
jgi:hypothetical protein